MNLIYLTVLLIYLTVLVMKFCSECSCEMNCITAGMEVRPCGNNKAMLDSTTGLEIDCGNGPHRQDCPMGSYCHITLTAARCCPKSELISIELLFGNAINVQTCYFMSI